MSTISKNYMMIGAAALVTGVALWYLSQDKEETKFDTSVHTVEKLRRLVKDLFIADATIYC